MSIQTEVKAVLSRRLANGSNDKDLDETTNDILILYLAFVEGLISKKEKEFIS